MSVRNQFRAARQNHLPDPLSSASCRTPHTLSRSGKWQIPRSTGWVRKARCLSTELRRTNPSCVASLPPCLQAVSLDVRPCSGNAATSPSGLRVVLMNQSITLMRYRFLISSLLRPQGQPVRLPRESRRRSGAQPLTLLILSSPSLARPASLSASPPGLFEAAFLLQECFSEEPPCW